MNWLERTDLVGDTLAWLALILVVVWGVGRPFVRGWRRSGREMRALEVKLRQKILTETTRVTVEDLDRYFVTPDGAEHLDRFMAKKLSQYEAGVDGPLCERCTHRWCPGDCN